MIVRCDGGMAVKKEAGLDFISCNESFFLHSAAGFYSKLLFLHFC